jgi:hypothetical protein
VTRTRRVFHCGPLRLCDESKNDVFGLGILPALPKECGNARPRQGDCCSRHRLNRHCYTVVRHAGGNRISLVLKLWPGCPVRERTRRFNGTLTGRVAKITHAESGALDRAVLLVANGEALANFYDRVWPQSPGGFDLPEPALLAALCSGHRYLIHDQNGPLRGVV